MNPTLLQDYNQNLAIIKAKIEMCETIARYIENAKDHYYPEEGVYYDRAELDSFPTARRVLFSQKSYIEGNIKTLKQDATARWQQLEPKPETYGYNAETGNWKSAHDATNFKMKHERWAEIEPFKTDKNDPT